MDRVELSANLRTKTGKGIARQLRRDGLVPGIVYGNKNNTPISLNGKDLTTLLRKTSANLLLHLKIENEKDKIVVIKEIQKGVIKRDILHLDLLEISMEKKLKITAPVEATGTPVGAKMGGILTRLMRKIKVECLPNNIPQSIAVDVTNLDVGQTLHVRDIQAPSGTTILDNPDETVFAVNLPEAEKSKEEAEETPEAAPAAAGEPETSTENKEKPASEKDK